MSATATSQKRTHFRGKARLPLRLDVAFCPAESDTGELSRAVTRNISLGGAFIVHDEPLPIGTEIYLEISLPGLVEPLELGAEVRWLIPPGDGNSVAGMGVEFVDTSVDTQLRLTEYFASRTGADEPGSAE